MLKSLKINNRIILVPEGLAFSKLKSGQYLVKFNGRSHYVTGGKASGGAANEWFVDGMGVNDIRVSGPVEAINLIVNA